ncbi:glutathione ABC transporter substrate-binding protein [Pullulanibacillus camelliae]|uniref:Glutathione-binding protein GsiB n=1 Tax=Pullulanibacillus camelliae TaxID=1707096 RepID=A0A8J2VJV6_9BACL|nr:glutathione ABC transporter substrate-binding protein [Pullulanibacillus camelliae]GGE27440.1 glutathione ABC transporter substrate-binding protein [Pullulanibacillus camelliae]
MIRSKKIMGAFLIVLLALVLTACSTTRSSSDSGGAASSDKKDKDINIAVNQDFTTLDPHNVSDTLSISATHAIYEGLVGFDKDMKIQPVLATDYKISDDGLTYTFHLRKNVKFQDGSSFNAEAVKANFDRIQSSKDALIASHYLQYLKSVKIVDDHTIQLILNQPFSAMLNKLTMVEMISPKALKDQGDKIGMHPVGTGPFEFVKWNQGESLILKKNPNYWDKGYPKVDQITYKSVPENGSRVDMLKTGEADFIYPLPEQSVQALKTQNDITVDQTTSNIVRYVTLNTNKKPFNDKKVRQAMNYALDKNAYIKVVKSGFGSELDSTMAPSTQFYSKQKVYNYDLSKAKELMKEAGYAKGFTAEIWGDTDSATMKGMQFIQQQMARINIKLKIKAMEQGTLSDAINTPKSPDDAKVQMWYVSWSPSSGDADGATRGLFSSAAFPPNGSNTAYYKNGEVDKLIDKANQTTDVEKQKSMYATIQKDIYNDAPWLFLGVDTNLSAHVNKLKGVYVLPDGSIQVKEAELQ